MSSEDDDSPSQGDPSTWRVPKDRRQARRPWALKVRRNCTGFQRGSRVIPVADREKTEVAVGPCAASCWRSAKLILREPADRSNGRPSNSLSYDCAKLL